MAVSYENIGGRKWRFTVTDGGGEAIVLAKALTDSFDPDAKSPVYEGLGLEDLKQAEIDAYVDAVFDDTPLPPLVRATIGEVRNAGVERLDREGITKKSILGNARLIEALPEAQINPNGAKKKEYAAAVLLVGE